MAISVTLTTIVKESAPSMRILVNFSTGTQLEFGSLAEVTSFVSAVETPENAQRFLVARWLAQHPDGSAPNSIEGKTLTIDAGAVNVISVSGG